ncbi:MAG: hypothetical protein HYR66_05615, partial [Sphingobacteriales bacterium]|nr:hypothetical protein [Sphingobacteriales bacterium]
MKYFIPALLAFLLLLNACSKGSNDPKPAPSPKDTLSSGWTKTNLTDTAFLTDIVFFDNNIGYTVNRSNIYRSTNGGTTWNKVLQSNQILSNIAVPGLNNALFLSPINIPSANSSKLFITTDGGNSFDSVVINDVNCSDVFFVSPTIGYLSG